MESGLLSERMIIWSSVHISLRGDCNKDVVCYHRERLYRVLWMIFTYVGTKIENWFAIIAKDDTIEMKKIN